MRKIQMVDLRNQLAAIREEVDAALADVFDSTAFINGPEVKKFAEELAGYLGARHAIPCGNGTDALQIALMALDLEPGDEVVTTPFTFVATAEVIGLLGYRPRFVDVEEDTFNIDVSKVKEVVGEKTRCLLPVHLFGQAADIAACMDLARHHDLKIVEDNAQSIGAEVRLPDGTSRKAGTFGEIGCTSFYPSKNLGAFGDGGAVFTDDDELAHRLRQVTNHGSTRKYYYDRLGVNSRLDSVQAAILRIKLRRLDRYHEARQRAADLYDERLRGIPGLVIPHRSPHSTHVFHQYTVKVPAGRDELQRHLSENEIPSQIYYPVPLHLAGAYARFGYEKGDFPVAERLAGEVLSLPMHSELDEEQIDFIAGAIRQFLES